MGKKNSFNNPAAVLELPGIGRNSDAAMPTIILAHSTCTTSIPSFRLLHSEYTRANPTEANGLNRICICIRIS